MANFAESLKGEIARVARREVKADLVALRKHVNTHRSEIASLKRVVKDLQRQLKATKKNSGVDGDPPTKAEAPGRRRSPAPGPASLTEFRAKMGITQTELAKLLKVSAVSVGKWESGKTIPRATQVGKIAQIIKLGKRAVAAQLSAQQ